MTLEVDVLRALLRLARRRTPPTLDQVVVRVGAELPAVRDALRALARAGLVQNTTAGLRLSLEGLAVAVACAKRMPSASSTPKAAKPQTVKRPAARRAA